jgi:hypothetical protein
MKRSGGEELSSPESKKVALEEAEQDTKNESAEEAGEESESGSEEESGDSDIDSEDEDCRTWQDDFPWLGLEEYCYRNRVRLSSKEVRGNHKKPCDDCGMRFDYGDWYFTEPGFAARGGDKFCVTCKYGDQILCCAWGSRALGKWLR